MKFPSISAISLKYRNNNIKQHKIKKKNAAAAGRNIFTATASQRTVERFLTVHRSLTARIIFLLTDTMLFFPGTSLKRLHRQILMPQGILLSTYCAITGATKNVS